MTRVSYWTSLIAAIGLVLGFGVPVAQSDNRNQPGSPPSNFESIVRDYILTHPEVIIQSLQSAKQKQEEEQRLAIQSYIKDHQKDLLEDPNSPVLGNLQGDVAIVEFFDYRCPYCRQVEPLLLKMIRDDPKLRVVQKQLPVLGPTSVLAARAALAAKKQGKEKQLHDALMSIKPDFDEAKLMEAAQAAGLNTVKLKADMAAPEVEAEIAKNGRLAKDLRLSGTPAFIVGSVLIPGATSLETLKSLVEDAREGTN
jgi:protein-disulfide isomerase